MSLIARASGGKNIVCRPMARPQWYPAASVNPATVEVYWRYDNEPAAAARLIGRYGVGQEVSFQHNPLEDRNLIFSTISIAPDGTRSVRELADAVEQTLIFQRETAAPVIGQVGDAITNSVTIGVMGFTKLARKRRLRIADALTGGGALDSPTVQIFDSGDEPMPSFIDIARAGALTPAFSWLGADPASNGFTKTGSAPVEAIGDGWRINSTGTDAATFYIKTSWPPSPFAAGFTLDLVAPTVNDTDNANPAESAAIRVEDGTHRYTLSFDADEVKLGAGSSHAIGRGRIRLVIAAGGATADLWVGDTRVEHNTAFEATSVSRLIFGDLVPTDDADVVWQPFSYALAAVPVMLARTIYVAVAHSSGGAFTPDSNILQLTFANEASGSGGTAGAFDATPRSEYDLLP